MHHLHMEFLQVCLANNNMAKRKKRNTIYHSYHSSSTNLRELIYNTDTKIVRVLFKSGWLYHFYGVPLRVFRAIEAAAPKGGKISWAIMQRAYPYRLLNKSGDIGNIDYED